MPVVLIPVKSSHIDAIAHHRGDLHIRFKGGTTYAYKDVPASLHAEMLEAESAGKFFYAKIKGKFIHVPVNA